MEMVLKLSIDDGEHKEVLTLRHSIQVVDNSDFPRMKRKSQESIAAEVNTLALRASSEVEGFIRRVAESVAAKNSNH